VPVAPALGELSKVISKLLFLDDEKLICVRLNQPEVLLSLSRSRLRLLTIAS
jgi:hypothetical protein